MKKVQDIQQRNVTPVDYLRWDMLCLGKKVMEDQVKEIKRIIIFCWRSYLSFISSLSTWEMEVG